MTDLSLLNEEIHELEEQVFRLKGSMNKEGNGVKNRRLAIITRILDGKKAERAALAKREVVA